MEVCRQIVLAIDVSFKILILFFQFSKIFGIILNLFISALDADV